MRALDNHVFGGGDKDTRRGFGVRFKKPDDDGNVVGDAVKGHGDGALNLKKICRRSIIVHERGRLDSQAWKLLHQIQQMLPNEELHVLAVRQRVRSSLR